MLQDGFYYIVQKDVHKKYSQKIFLQISFINDLHVTFLPATPECLLKSIQIIFYQKLLQE